MHSLLQVQCLHKQGVLERIGYAAVKRFAEALTCSSILSCVKCSGFEVVMDLSGPQGITNVS